MNNNKALANARSAIPETFQFTSCPLPPNSPGQNLCSDSEGVNTPPRDFVQRILPLGASITWGQGSTTGNGYRKVLADKIIAAGGKVNYVGSRQSGTMDDSDVEGTQVRVFDLKTNFFILSQLAVELTLLGSHYHWSPEKLGEFAPLQTKSGSHQCWDQ